MRKVIFIILSLFFFNLLYAQSRSSIVFDAGTHIEVTGVADICADSVRINGTYSGNGTLCGGPLPVQLVTFLASYNNNGDVILNWRTETEINNFGFEIERCVILSPQCSWETIGFVEGSGNSNSPKEYSFIDKNPPSGKIKYRLKQLNNDGSFSYSNEIEVEIYIPKEFVLYQNYPNPFNPVTTISFTLAEDAFTTLKVYDILGNEVMVLVNDKLKSGQLYKVELNGDKLASGLYFYRLESGSNVATKKLILMK